MCVGCKQAILDLPFVDVQELAPAAMCATNHGEKLSEEEKVSCKILHSKPGAQRGTEGGTEGMEEGRGSLASGERRGAEGRGT